MPSKQAILETLQRPVLAGLVAHFELPTTDRRSKEGLISALVATKQVKFGQVLAQLPLAALKEICRQFEVDDAGRDKATLIDRLSTAAAAKRAASKPAKVKEPKTKAPPAAKVTKLTTVAAPVAPAPTAASKKRKAAAAEIKPVVTVTATPPVVKKKPVKSEPEAVVSAAISKGNVAIAAQPAAKSAAVPAAKPGPALKVMPRPPEQELLSLPLARGEDVAITLATQIKKCMHCHKNVSVRKCQVQKCRNLILIDGASKICSECLFERNTLSIVDFNQRLIEETACPHCSKPWQNNA